MPSYEELKAEVVEISKIVEKCPEQIRSQIFDLLIQEYLGKLPPPSQKGGTRAGNRPQSRSRSRTESTKDKGAKKGKKGAGKESYSIDRNLNLRGDKSIPSFKTFFAEKKPDSAKAFNAVTVYYLRKMLGMDAATLDHAYTCYAEVNQKPPQAFRQSFIDTKNKEGWVEFDSKGNLDIPHRGIVFVEHDLPKPEKTKKK